MATEAKALEVLDRTRAELAEDLFEKMFEGVLEQAAMTPEQQELLAERIGGQESTPAILQSRDNLAVFYHRWLSEAAIRREEAKRLEEQARAIERVAERISQGVKLQMEMWGVKKIEGARHLFKLQGNPRPRVIIEDEKLIPTEFLIYEPKPDRNAIRDALDAGKQVSGCRLDVAGTYLKIV